MAAELSFLAAYLAVPEHSTIDAVNSILGVYPQSDRQFLKFWPK
jgi:hypothetical protein